MAKQKVRLADNIARVIWVDPDATNGATLDQNLFLPGGKKVATPQTLREYLGLGSQGGTLLHKNLRGLQQGDDHPQYTMWAAKERITGRWTFANEVDVFIGDVQQWHVNTVRVQQNIPLIVTSNDGIRVDNPTEVGSGIELTTFGTADPNGVGSQLAFWERAAKNYGFRFRHAGEVVNAGDLEFWRHDNNTTGVLFMRFTRDSDQVQFAAGTAAAPVITFIGDLNTGIYQPGADALALTAGGVARLSVSGTAIVSTVPIRTAFGSAGAPGYAFDGDTDVGMYRIGANQLGWSIAGSNVWALTATGFTSTVLFQGPSGTAGGPAYSFAGDPNTGVFSAGADTLGFATGGVERLGVGSAGELRLSGGVGAEGQIPVSHGPGSAVTWEDMEVGGSLVYANIDVPAGNTVGGTSEVEFDTVYLEDADNLVPNVLYRVKAFGHFSTDANASPTLQLRVKLGGTTLLDSGAVSLDTSVTDGGWNLEAHLLVLEGGASGEIEAQGYFMVDGAVHTVANTAPITIDLSTDLEFAISAEFNQADDDAITLRQLMIERHPYVDTPSPADTYRIAITVPDASIAATLTDFPVYVDLSDMPAEFWTHLAHDDGGDIRVKTGAGVDIPFDLIWIDRAGERGAVFFKQTLTNGGDTTAYIHYGEPANTLVAPGAANGRNAVWSDYHRVFTFGSDPFTDRTGSGNDLTATAPANGPDQFTNTSTSADLGVHQGVAWDGTYYYVVDNNLIKKYDASFSLVASNSNPCGDILAATGDAVDHCGDPCVVDGVLYVPAEVYVNVSTWSLMKIARFNASDLSFIGADSIAAQNHEAASICYKPDEDMLYVASFADGSKLFKYARADRSYQGTLPLSTTLPNIQGVTFWRGAFWINSDNAAYDATLRVTASGTVQGRVWGITGGNYEGIDFNDAGLLVLHDTTGGATGVVRQLEPIGTAVGGGVDFPAGATRYLTAPSVTRYTTWTIGLSVNFDSLATNAALVSYTQAGQASNTPRATVGYRLATTQLGLWNQADTWLNDTLTPPSTGVTYRLHATHNGTTDRKFYRNGGNQQVDLGITAKPDSAANCLLLGVEDTSLTELLDGKLGFVYLRASELSADWIAAEYANLNAPASFYSVGTEEVV